MTPRRSTFSLKCLVCLGLIRCAAMSTTKSGPTLSCVTDLSHENMSCDQSVLHCCMKCNAPNVQIFVFIHLTTVNMGNCPLSAASCASNPADCDNYKVDIGGHFELASIEHGVVHHQSVLPGFQLNRDGFVHLRDARALSIASTESMPSFWWTSN
jgi:hypothetical protein